MAQEPEILFTESDVAERVRALAERISHDYATSDEVVLVGVLKGAFIFLADLARSLTVLSRVEFLAVSSYGGASQGQLHLVMDLRADIRDRHVLLVEDIVDTGETLRWLKETLASRSPASLRTCTLTRKASSDHIPVDYLGFELPDRWAVGCGLDYADRYRTLPYIGAIDPEKEEGK